MHRAFVFTLALAAALFPAWGSTQPAKVAPQPAKVPSKVLTFYYPWYGTPEGPGGKSHGGKFVHWEGVEPTATPPRIASSTNYPTGGVYDSHDPAVIKRHCTLAKDAGIDGLIISWWGKGTFEDQATPAILDGCAKHGLQAAVYYEQVKSPTNAAAAVEELTDIAKRFGSHAAYLKVDDNGQQRPVIFIYSRAIFQLDWKAWETVVAELHKTVSPAPFIVADCFDSRAIKLFDGVHDYGPAGGTAAAIKKGETAEAWSHRTMPWWVSEAHKYNKLSCVTVFPGYDDLKIRKPGIRVDRDNGRFYDTLWKDAIAAKPDWVLITSFNEWHEGSEIEPSNEHGDKYIKATAEWAKKFKQTTAANEPPTPAQPDKPAK
ncbi:MAG: glycoside hydrolase family 99-like domain-containing protein [Phycisphaerales bacterium]